MTAAVLAAVSTAGTLAVPLFVKYIVSSFTHGENVLLPIVLIIVSALVAASTSAGSAYLLARIGESVILRLRGRVMSHTLKLPLKSVSGSGVGNLVSRITSDATLLRAVIDVGIVQLPLAIITIGFTVVVMAILDWVLVLVTVGSFALAGGAIWLVLRRVRANVMEQQSAIGKLADAFTSYLMSLTTVKSYQVEDRISRRLTGQAGDLMKVSVVGARLQSTIAPVMTLGQQVALVAVVIGGGARITAGALSLGDFAAFIMYLLQLVAPITMAATGIGRLQAGLAARNRFNELLSMPTEAGEASDVGTPRGCDAVDAAIAFKNVTFGHRSDDSALNGVSFAIPRRGVTAMVGPSGAGKTTALMLIERFVEAREGTVEVMGRDVIDWSLDELRGKIAYVDQTFTSIVGTVRENLQLGMSRQCDDEELWRALEKVCMKEEIAALPEALDTELGHESDLSGGQKQRIALARALLAEREVILLDEPSSQLDSTNERNLRKVISEIGETRPVVVVAHRLSTIRSATHVVMLEGGGVAGSGNHDVLMSSCAEYNRMISNDYTGSDVDEIAVGAG